jgi:two-component system sensor histidine kinase KdpD
MAAAGRQDTQLEQLVLTSLSLTLEHSLDGVLQRVAATGAAITGARHAAIGLTGVEGTRLERLVTHGTDRPWPDGTPPPDGPGVLVVPVIGRRGVLGHLYLGDTADGLAFSHEDRHLAELLAATAAAAVENARSHEESARLLAEVQQLHRTRERFFAMVNHELRNALAAVHGWAQLLVRKKDPASLPPAAFEVLDAAEQAVGLINDLLDLSRLDEDRLKPVLRAVDPAGMARHAIARAEPGARARQITIALELEEPLSVVETDASRVEQILVNLLINATKYAPEGSTIGVRISAADVVTFRVLDEGPGVLPADAEAIFDVYYTTADGEKDGIGLGLPLSRRLARLLGGELAVIPHAGGGEFVLTLPRPRAAR